LKVIGGIVQDPPALVGRITIQRLLQIPPTSLIDVSCRGTYGSRCRRGVRREGTSEAYSGVWLPGHTAMDPVSQHLRPTAVAGRQRVAGPGIACPQRVPQIQASEGS